MPFEEEAFGRPDRGFISLFAVFLRVQHIWVLAFLPLSEDESPMQSKGMLKN